MTTTGNFIWYELMTGDTRAAGKFYGAVVGWTVADRADPQAGTQDYHMIVRSDGGFAGGVLKLSPDMQKQGAHPAWLGYLHVRNVDAATAAIEADGGRILMPKKILPVGAIALVTDPMGTPFYVMDPVRPAGNAAAKSDVFDPAAPQRVRWNELASPDPARAKAFYSKHFGFEFNEAMPMGPLGDYCFIDVGGLRVGAIMQKPEHGAGAAWLFYFGVPSIAIAKTAIEKSGGRVTRAPQEVPGGDWVVVAADPQAVPFGLVGSKGDF
jgi:hypothetical protein